MSLHSLDLYRWQKTLFFLVLLAPSLLILPFAGQFKNYHGYESTQHLLSFNKAHVAAFLAYPKCSLLSASASASPSSASVLPSPTPPVVLYDSDTPLRVPEFDKIVDSALQLPEPDEFCAVRFTKRYLDDFRDHSIQYCTGRSQSRLTCFHAHDREDGGIDSFCLATDVVFRAQEKLPVTVDCKLRMPEPSESARGLIAFQSLKPIWFDTGPKYLFEHYVQFKTPWRFWGGKKAATASEEEGKPDRIVMLVRREGGNNLWHGLMELWSMTVSFDILRLTRDPESVQNTTALDVTGTVHGTVQKGLAPYFQYPSDMKKVHVVMLDDFRNDTPIYDLWRIFSPNPIVHLRNIRADPVLAAQFAATTKTVLFPLPGGSNPLWQNDWDVRDTQNCRYAPVLALFVQRVFAHVGLEQHAGPRPLTRPNDMVVTFVNRTGTRRLVAASQLLTSLKQRFPAVTVQSVDLADLTLREQMEVVQQTDVLVGVHGAGLTHGMFMREGAGALVEIRPAAMDHLGFRNLAGMRGIKYFTAHAASVLPSNETADERQHWHRDDRGEKRDRNREKLTGNEKEDWHLMNVRMEEARFLALMDVAIKSLYNEGMRSQDVV